MPISRPLALCAAAAALCAATASAQSARPAPRAALASYRPPAEARFPARAFVVVVPAAPRAPADADTALRSLLEADRALSAATEARGLAGGLGAGLADDVVFLHPGRPLVRGAEAARALLAEDARASAVVRWTALRGEVSADGTRGYTMGWSEAVAGERGATHGKYVAFWRRAGRGGWEVAAYVHVRGPGPEALPEGFAPGPDPAAAPARRPSGAGAARAQVVAADSAFSALAGRAGVTEAFHAFAAPDAAILGEGQPTVWGRDAIGRGPRGPGGPTLVWAPVQAEAAGSGDLALTVGEAVLTAPAAAGEAPRRRFTKYLTVWKRQPDGAWRYVADSGNERPGEG